ncbi:MAG: NAD(P)/FAD-dependent oxidoreductase [Candidatus Hydrogenedentota bacterium]|nr:MAG: NAD(P)/FAD-dependent oxidoreductase [Candidatus Hydrogenedentota bacterium]
MKYDVIVIGSGIGGLCIASLLAQEAKKKVLILERHWQLGGFTHTFKRKRKYEWDVGVHYIGGVGEGEQLRRVYDKITLGKLKWQKMPNPYDVFDYPDMSFAVPDGAKPFMEKLVSTFPQEEKAIRKYFKDLKRAMKWYQLNEAIKGAPLPFKPFLKLMQGSSQFALQTLHQYLDNHFQDVKLKAILASQWGDYGLPPKLVPFVMHAILVLHYINGAYYPVGGAAKIAEYALDPIHKAGGEALTNAEVKEILFDEKKKRAVGVRVYHTRKKEEEKFYAPLIISNAGAYITYTQLIPNNMHPWQQAILDFVQRNPTTGHISVYLGLKDSPEKLGIQGENHWIYQQYNHNEAFEKQKRWTGDTPPAVVYASFPSLKNPEAEAHTAELITFATWETFEKWKDLPWRKRGSDYETLKEKMTKQMVQVVDRKFPGFSKLIDYQETSTPLSTHTMTAHYKGTIYGLPAVPERFDLSKSPWCAPKTPFKGLYLTGTDVAGLGVSGALMGGVETAIALLGPRPSLLRLL